MIFRDLKEGYESSGDEKFGDEKYVCCGCGEKCASAIVVWLVLFGFVCDVISKSVHQIR